MAHPVFYFHSLINSGRLRDIPTCTRVKATQQVRELGLLTTTPPLLHRLLYSRELRLMPSDSAEFFTALAMQMGV